MEQLRPHRGRDYARQILVISGHPIWTHTRNLIPSRRGAYIYILYVIYSYLARPATLTGYIYIYIYKLSFIDVLTP